MEKSQKNNKSVPKFKPPPPPFRANNNTEAFVSVPSPSLHNYNGHDLSLFENNNKENKNIDNDDNNNNDDNNDDNDNDDKYEPTTLSKKRLMLELERYLFEKPPSPHKPRVEFECNRYKFIIDLQNKFDHFGKISSSTGSILKDVENSINTGLDWVVNKTNPIVSFGSMIANGFKKKMEIKELKTIPPPLLIIYLNQIEKALAEQFAELLTIITNESGVIISVLNYNDHKLIQKWLDPSSINATKSNDDDDKKEDNNNKDKDKDNDDDEEIEDYAYNPHENEYELSSSHRTILRVCILLYSSEIHSHEIVNDLVSKYENKFNLKSICGVEMKKVSDKPSKSISDNVPNCYVGNIFYDETDGIVQGQESIFDSIAKCVFSPNNEFDDEEDQINHIHL